MLPTTILYAGKLHAHLRKTTRARWRRMKSIFTEKAHRQTFQITITDVNDTIEGSRAFSGRPPAPAVSRRVFAVFAGALPRLIRARCLMANATMAF